MFRCARYGWWTLQTPYGACCGHGERFAGGGRDCCLPGFEDPLSSCAVAAGERARCWVERELPLKAGQSVTYSSVIGVAPDGQLRRGFLHYVERERAHPVSHFSELQLVVRPRILQQIR